jgi:exo-rhamnogalacturonan lyase-like protein
MRDMLRALGVALLVSAACGVQAAALDVPISVKEVAGVGATRYPVTVVVPLERGTYTDTSKFRLVDADGKPVPAQIDVLNRWWVDLDRSIRHLVIHFQPTVEPFSKPGTGITVYRLRDDGPAPKPTTPLTLAQDDNAVTIVTGPLKFVVRKKQFNILDRVWHDTNGDGKFAANEEVISSSAKNGGVYRDRFGVQHDTARGDVTIDVEEAGPLQVVIRAEAVTRYKDERNHTHGWAVRIYAYAGKPFVKIDYQLQNSSKDFTWTGPMYFESMDLDFKLNLATDATATIGLGDGKVWASDVRAEPELRQTRHNKFAINNSAPGGVPPLGRIPDGFLDVSDAKRGVTAVVRHFWEMWPNGIKTDADRKLSVQLFPEWSAMLYKGEGARWKRAGYPFKNELSPTGLYWLDDMRHVYKEVLLHFHGPKTSPKEMIALARTFDEHPVGTLPTAWYARTRATLHYDGHVPYEKRVTDKDLRKPVYSRGNYSIRNCNAYIFNWNNFEIARIRRRWLTNAHGSWPLSGSALTATENPSDYWYAERLGIGELNGMAQWMAQYKHDRDFAKLKLDQAPYIQDWPHLWRHFAGFAHRTRWKWYYPKLRTKYLPATGLTAGAKDDQHAWHYHAEEAYYFTANPWIKDWYKFVAEFRRTTLDVTDRYPSLGTGRGVGHPLSNALQAYHVTGDTSIIKRLRERLVKTERRGMNPYLGRYHGIGASGYYMQMLITFMRDVERSDRQAWAEAFVVASGLVEANVAVGNFAYSVKSNKSSGTAQEFADCQAWYYWNTGKKHVFDHLKQYLTTGINGGQKPIYCSFDKWRGAWTGRMGQYVMTHKKADATPPPRVTDLRGVRNGAKITLTWTAPRDADRYLIVWSDKAVSESYTPKNDKTANWWACDIAAPDIKATPGAKQTATVRLDDPWRSACQGKRSSYRKKFQVEPAPPLKGRVNFHIFSFDAANNMSSISERCRVNP